ncbi:hypothetical protein KC953_00800, partial [Candidatus Saccharibacteria bacterium]|nr:hypothetical protein [Candidatus Saccharibacteria bacterium]
MKTPLDVDERVGEIADPFSQKREELRRTQKQAEAEAANVANSGLAKKSPGSTSLQNLEQSANPISSRNSHSLQTKNPANNPFGYLDKFTKIKLKGASSLITVVLAVFMGGGFLTVLFSPSLAIIQMKEVLTHALNDQLHATDTRSKSIFRATMKGPANCGTVKICKRFTTMSTTQVHEFEKHKNIKIERDMIDEKNGRVRKILFTNQLGEKISISNSSELQSALKNNVEFKAAWTKGFNPQFKTLSDSLMLKVLYKLKATKNQDISGKNDEERRKKLNQIGGGVERTNARAIIEGKDEDGKKTYTDENGNKLDPKDVEAAKAMEGRVEGYMKSGGAGGVLKKAAINGVSVTGTADTACSLYNGIRHVSALAKNVKKAQMARYALALVLTPADRIKAGAASEADTTFVG